MSARKSNMADFEQLPHALETLYQAARTCPNRETAMGSDDEDDKKIDFKDVVAMVIAILINLMPLFLVMGLLFLIILVFWRIWF
jgi:hypothetical protein